jgi:hypothetical protein
MIMLKYSFAVAVMSLGLVASLPAEGAFSGAFAPGTWTTTFIGDVLPPGPVDNGTVDTSGAPASVTIIGGDDPSNPFGNFNSCVGGVLFGCEIRYSHAAAGGPVSFAWSYSTVDSCGAQCDLFGVLLGGVEHLLSDPGGLATQAGSFGVGNVPLVFFISCGQDCAGGAARVVISRLTVPEPGTLALIGLGLAASCFMRRRIG